MDENYHGANYELAKAEADKVDKQIIEALREGHSFRVEAGAGSGKTYSLNRVIYYSCYNSFVCLECNQTISKLSCGCCNNRP